MNMIFIAILVSAISLSSAIDNSESSKLISESKESAGTKDLETSASDRFFLGAKDYSTYGSAYNYGSYPGSYYNNYNGYYPSSNSVYRGYQSGLSGILGPRYNGYGNGYGYGNYGLGGSVYNGYANGVGYGTGLGGIGVGYDDSLSGRGYNRWNTIDGTYGGYYSGGYVNRLNDYLGHSGYSGYGLGSSNYPYRGISSYSYNSYPSGYRGYS
ncbi:hypothetical protein G9C98_005327 [Cotesia typhae]|uniref:Uncharacterized protein n=1 Tax=Cotesia typhae TaxID=2053667 RepID=A0A8J5UU91_9HYME|nr:hypothetical protein G9C98_005327 [Cotesia typhae]